MAQVNERIALAEQATKSFKKEVEREDDNHHDDNQQVPIFPDTKKKENKTPL